MSRAGLQPRSFTSTTVHPQPRRCSQQKHPLLPLPNPYYPTRGPQVEEATFWWTEQVTSHLWASRTPPVSWMISPASRLDPKGVTQHVHECLPIFFTTGHRWSQALLSCTGSCHALCTQNHATPAPPGALCLQPLLPVLQPQPGQVGAGGRGGPQTWV